MIMILPLLFSPFFPFFFLPLCACVLTTQLNLFHQNGLEKKRWMHFELLQVGCARCPLLLLCFSSPAPDCSWCLKCRFNSFLVTLFFIQGGFWITDFQEIPFLHQSLLPSDKILPDVGLMVRYSCLLKMNPCNKSRPLEIPFLYQNPCHRLTKVLPSVDLMVRYSRLLKLKWYSIQERLLEKCWYSGTA